MLTKKQLVDAYLYACEVELQAFKPGNVSIYADGHDMTVEDFRVSARQSVTPLTNTDYSLGERIYYAVKETRAAVGCNTNLGILLLSAPLIMAAETARGATDIQKNLQSLLTQTTVNDADWVFRAIALAAPGGLGQSKQQDVTENPQVTLIQAMKLAENRDRIAWQFTTNYKDIFDFLVLRYNEKLNQWDDSGWAAVAVYSAMLAKYPDSHIERKYGNLHTRMVMDKMALVDDKLSQTDSPERLEGYLRNVDTEFKTAGINPGTTADLTVITVLAAKLMQVLG